MIEVCCKAISPKGGVVTLARGGEPACEVGDGVYGGSTGGGVVRGRQLRLAAVSVFEELADDGSVATQLLRFTPVVVAIGFGPAWYAVWGPSGSRNKWGKDTLSHRAQLLQERQRPFPLERARKMRNRP
jgi:hypothetical protein